MIASNNSKPNLFNGNVYNESFLDGLIRKVVYRIIRNLPKDSYYQVTSILKKIKSGDTSTKFMNELTQNVFSIISNDIFHDSPNVCITHDIDSIYCLRELENTFTVNQSVGAKASLHFLTNADYSLDRIDFEGIISGGNLVGLHGDHHDIALGYRNRNQFKKRIQSCLNRLPTSEFKIFRAPGFGMCINKLHILQELGFALDTSATSGFLFNRDSYFGILQTEQLSKLEIKVAVVNYSDDRVIRELGAPINIQKKLIDLILLESISMKSTAIFNFHPGISSKEITHYEEIVQHFSNRSAKFRTLAEI
jgi:hypothetical protein